MNYFNDLNELNNMEAKGNEGDGKKAGVVDIFVSSVIKIRQLPEVAMNSEKRFVLYVVFISLFVAFLTFLMPIATGLISLGGLKNVIKNSLPAFTVSDGKLESESPFKMKLDSTYILIDTSKESFGADDFENAGIYVTFGSKYARVSVVTDDGEDISYTEMSSIRIGDVFSEGFTNDNLLSLIPTFYITAFICFIVVAAFTAAKYLLAAIFYMIISLPMTLLCKFNLSTKDSYRLSFYAQTIGIIIVALYTSLISGQTSIIASVAGIVITYFVIQRALRPQPKSGLFGGFGGGDDDDDSDDDSEE